MTISIKKGFTLIELLVVIAIIGLLSSVVLASLTSVKNKANLSVVSQEIHELQNAVELYNTDNGGYPDTGNYNDYLGPYNDYLNGSTGFIKKKLNLYLPNGLFLNPNPTQTLSALNNNLGNQSVIYYFATSQPGTTAGQQDLATSLLYGKDVRCGGQVISNYAIFVYSNTLLPLPVATYDDSSGNHQYTDDPYYSPPTYSAYYVYCLGN